MPPKPTNPTTKDLEDAIQGAHQRIDEALQHNNIDLNNRFNAVNQNMESHIGRIYTRLDNQQSTEDARFATLTSQLSTLINRSPPPRSSKPSSSGITLHHTASTVLEPITITAIPTSPIFHPYLSSPNFQSHTSTHSSPSTGPIFTSAIRTTTNTSTPFTQIPPPSNYTLPPYPYLGPPYSSLSSQPQFQQPITQTTTPPFTPFPTFPLATPSQSGQNPNSPTLHSPKLDLIPFDGSDPLEWLFQADQFFCFYNIPMESRLHMSAFYMKGDALSWFKWTYQNNQMTDWLSFTNALELRFGQSTYDNHQEELFKLRQNGTVFDYQTQFEKLGNRVLGLPAEAIMNCFISGLQPEIRNELAIQKLHTISQAIGVAKLIEAKHKDSKPKYPRPFSYPTNQNRFPPNIPKNPLPQTP